MNSNEIADLREEQKDLEAKIHGLQESLSSIKDTTKERLEYQELTNKYDELCEMLSKLHTVFNVFKFKERKQVSQSLDSVEMEAKRIERIISENEEKKDELLNKIATSEKRIKQIPNEIAALQKAETIACEKENRINKAEQGDAQAQYELGIYYAKEAITRKDFDKAKLWINKALEQGHEKAQEALNDVNREIERKIAEDNKKEQEKARHEPYIQMFAEVWAAYEITRGGKPGQAEAARRYNACCQELHLKFGADSYKIMREGERRAEKKMGL